MKLAMARNWKRYAAAGVGLMALAGGVRARRTRRRPRMRYDRGYREEVVLADGARALVRLVRPYDRKLLAAGMAQLSAEGRYRRFHVPKHHLSTDELRYLTELDYYNHFAIGALGRTGLRQGLGVARFVRLAHRPDTAEFAIAVADEAQGKGLGRMLLSRLAEAARERGIGTLTCETLATNLPFLRLMGSLFRGVKRRTSGPVVTLEVSLTSG
jgi:GNAT superfamily N-acetyltransferase